MFKFTAASKIEDFLLVSSLIVCSAASIALIWLVFCCFLKRRRRLSYSSDQSLFEVRRISYRGHKHCIESICSDQQYIVTVSIAGVVKAWDTHSTHCVMEISPSNRYWNSLYSPVLFHVDFYSSCSYWIELLYSMSYWAELLDAKTWFLVCLKTCTNFNES